MKRSTVFILICILSCLLSFSLAETDRFVDPETGISVVLPDGWKDVPNMNGDKRIKFQVSNSVSGNISISLATYDYYTESKLSEKGIDRQDVDMSFMTDDIISAMRGAFEEKSHEVKKIGDYEFHVTTFPMTRTQFGLTFNIDCEMDVTIANGYIIVFSYMAMDHFDENHFYLENVIKSMKIELGDANEKTALNNTGSTVERAIIPSETSIVLKKGETKTIEITVTGIKDKESLTSKLSENGICYLKWYKRNKTADGAVFPVDITGSGIGKTELMISLDQATKTTILIETISDDSPVSSNSGKTSSARTIILSETSVVVKKGETKRIEIKVTGISDKETLSSKFSESGKCYLKWYKREKTGDGVVFPLDITGSGVGKTELTLSIGKDAKTTIQIETVDEDTSANTSGAGSESANRDVLSSVLAAARKNEKKVNSGTYETEYGVRFGMTSDDVQEIERQNNHVLKGTYTTSNQYQLYYETDIRFYSLDCMRMEYDFDPVNYLLFEVYYVTKGGAVDYEYANNIITSMYGTAVDDGKDAGEYSLLYEQIGRDSHIKSSHWRIQSEEQDLGIDLWYNEYDTVFIMFYDASNPYSYGAVNQAYSDDTGISFTYSGDWSSFSMSEFLESYPVKLSLTYRKDSETSIQYIRTDMWENLKETLEPLGFVREDIGFEFLNDTSVSSMMQPIVPQNLRKQKYNMSFYLFEHQIEDSGLSSVVYCTIAMTMKDGYLHMFMFSSTTKHEQLLPEFEEILSTVVFKN